MIKRLFDILFSFLGLLTTLPFLLIIALVIKLSSKGPVFYRGERIGKNGKPFRIFKFRTMVIMPIKWEVPQPQAMTRDC